VPPEHPWVDLGLDRDDSEHLLERSTALLDAAGRDGRARLRWYVPTDAAIVLGRGQRTATEVPGHVQLQRPSGGGAVLMDADLLSLDVVLPAGHPWLHDTDLGAVFDPIGEAWARRSPPGSGHRSSARWPRSATPPSAAARSPPPAASSSGSPSAAGARVR
jgi:hypothetical protein